MYSYISLIRHILTRNMSKVGKSLCLVKRSMSGVYVCCCKASGINAGGNLDHVSDKLQSSRKQKVTAARSRMGGWGLKGERQPSKGY